MYSDTGSEDPNVALCTHRNARVSMLFTWREVGKGPSGNFSSEPMGVMRMTSVCVAKGAIWKPANNDKSSRSGGSLEKPLSSFFYFSCTASGTFSFGVTQNPTGCN